VTCSISRDAIEHHDESVTQQKLMRDEREEKERFKDSNKQGTQNFFSSYLLTYIVVHIINLQKINTK
jgi:hypothetical protein